MQIGKTLLLDDELNSNCLSAIQRLYYPQLMQLLDSNFLNNHAKDTFFGHGKDVIQRIAKSLACQAEKTPKDIAETVQCIFKKWKDKWDSLSLRKECGQNQILNDQYRQSQKHLVKANHRCYSGGKGLSLLGNDKDWTLEQLWKKIMWADESRFILFQSHG